METKELEHVIYEKEDHGVARVILNWPEKSNAQDSKMVWSVEQALDWAEHDDSVKVVIIKANGRGFSSGHAVGLPDALPELQSTAMGAYHLFVKPVLHLWEFPKATISQVHGYCVGGGTMFAYPTDMTIASDDAYFQMPLPQGLAFPSAETMIEPWLMMNWKHVYEYLYTTKTLDAQTAKEWGLVNQVVPRDDLEYTVEETAAFIAQMPLSTILGLKNGVKRGLGNDGRPRAHAVLQRHDAHRRWKRRCADTPRDVRGSATAPDCRTRRPEREGPCEEDHRQVVRKGARPAQAFIQQERRGTVPGEGRSNRPAAPLPTKRRPSHPGRRARCPRTPRPT